MISLQLRVRIYVHAVCCYRGKKETGRALRKNIKENMINQNHKDKDLLALIQYIAQEDKLEKILENPQVIKTPVVRNGKLSTIGYQPDVWKGWI